MPRIVDAFDLRVRQGSQRWHAARRDGIGASEISAVLGLSPYDSPMSLFHKKKGVIPDYADNARMEWGRRLERVILKRALDAHPELSGPIITTRAFRSKDRPWQMASPDAIAWEEPNWPHDEPSPVVVEIKTGSSKDDWGDDGSDDIPLHYRCQVMQTMDVVGARRAIVPVLFNGREYREYHIRWDADEVAILRDRGARFWRDLQDGIAPTIDGHKATSEVMKTLWDVDPTQTVEVPADLVEKLARAKAIAKRAAAQVDLHENRLRAAIGDASKATVYGETVATRSVWKQNQFDKAAFQADHPDLAAKYTSKAPRQRLNFKGAPQ